MDLAIHPIKLFKDNYIWALTNKQSLWVVDPGDAVPVIDFIEKNHFHLMGALITHHHNDHCLGVSALKEKYNITVYGPTHPAIQATHVVNEGDKIYLPDLDLSFSVLSIPGHTLEHVAYFCASESFVFCGDTLFSAGCGRVFEGTYEQMYQSLHRLSSLPDTTKIYPAHEYTLSNLLFAKHIEPDNLDIDSHILHVKQCLESDSPSLPSTIFLEKKINPFLRSHMPSVINKLQNQLNRTITDPAHCFSELRFLKNSFA